MDEAGQPDRPWKKWGPYLSERQWGTVREDYSEGGNAWDYFTHDQARSRAYRWGEDGLLGLTDRQCRLCFAVALWNERDPILKERLFGLFALSYGVTQITTGVHLRSIGQGVGTVLRRAA